MQVLLKSRWCVILFVIALALGWAMRALPAATIVDGGAVILAEGGGDGGDGEGDEGIEFA